MVIQLRENRTSPVVAKYRSIHDEDLCFEEVMAVLEAPSARFLEATALFLVELARRGEIVLPTRFSSSDALRRLGFISERLSIHRELTKEVRGRLKRFADEIYSDLSMNSVDDLGFSNTTTPARIRRLKRRGDGIDLRWRVWGEVELRTEYLQ